MKVTEVIIDGFKSYQVRTVISGWDESFNSITGLNGSGKSNILDAICFVLGITNMSTVRAQNLQDLIYKRGQAGVTKASVTITFDNRDKKTSPVGFEDYATISVTRQIVLGGTSKYLINGHRAQQQTVQNLFQSVQLNINNPNFLIMQGRITKVLNMKPQEILAMIEEAAGTRMFEDRRDKAFKTMAKKELKVQEITELLKEEIDPKLEKLRQEKRAFLDFQQTQGDLERLTRLVVAYDYVKGKERLQRAADDLDSKTQRVALLEENATKFKNEIAILEEDIRKVKSARDKELRKGGKFQALEEQVNDKSHEMVRLTTMMDLKNKTMTEEAASRQQMSAHVADLENQLEQKRQELSAAQNNFDTANQELREKTTEVNEKEDLLQSLQTGLSSQEGKEGGYQGQLQNAKARVTDAKTEQEQAQLKISHLEKKIKEDEPHAKKAKEQNTGLVKNLQKLRDHAKELEAQLSAIGCNPGEAEARKQRESALRQRIRELQSEVDSIKREVSNIDFSYADPSPNFDRSKVKGLVANLFSLDKSQSKAGTALEICAGGRLYNVVVDSSETGSQLLQNGKLRKRVTIIPLNKINAFRASAAKVGAAEQLAPGKANIALSLVGYDKEVSAAMEYVFGSTFICADPETAKKITFDPAVRMRCITLDGDVYDPSGTLSGGSAPRSSGVLLKLQRLNEFSSELDIQIKELAELQAIMAREENNMEAARNAKEALDLKNHEILLAEEQINQNAASSTIRKLEEMRESITQLKRDLSNAKSRQDEASKEVKRIEKDMKEYSSNKDGKLMELEKTLEKLKKVVSDRSAAIKPLQQTLREVRFASEQLESDLQAARESLDESDTNLEQQRTEIASLTEEQKQTKSAHDEALAQLEDERAKLTGFDDELQSLEEASTSKTSQIREDSLEIQRLGHQIEKLQKDKKGASDSLAQLQSDYEWIAEDKNSFGRTGTVYDFGSQNMAESKSSLKTLTERIQGMKRKVNPKVMNMIDSVEKREVALKNMMKTVIRDKKKIEETISSLDEYKKEALEKTWTKVNHDFGQIFAELLPGSFAKLDPLEGKSISEGLEVKVQLGKVWKQSLTELSGGQRSLIALSLIMALLQFKPAPMYILDEVDAALDLSHTQNIGRLIKTRFKGSQFIVVSLKDGMFQNANRIFRTRFSDGTSVVQALTAADLK